MAELIYVANVSLDGYIEDAAGSFEWTAPNDEVFAFITDLVRPVGTYLYGRRMYETMAVWETQPALAAQSELMGDSHAFNAGLVDECQLFVHPVLVGQGKPAFPIDARIQLELLEERRFGSGVVNLRYGIRS